MKKRNETKLGLDKLRITKLENPLYIIGGFANGPTKNPRTGPVKPPPDAESPSRGEDRTAKEKRYRSEGDCP